MQTTAARSTISTVRRSTSSSPTSAMSTTLWWTALLQGESAADGYRGLASGSCWINQLRETCDVPEVRALLTEYGVPEDHIVVCSAAIGYIEKETPAKPRHEGLGFDYRIIEIMEN